MLWNVDDRGFLPSCDPIIQIPVSNYKNTQLIFTLENLAHMMPCFLTERCWREEVIYELRQVISKFGPVLVDKLSSPSELERAFLLFNMFANGYMFSYGDSHMPELPKEIAIPLYKVAKLCGRQPTLDYTSYVLYNWQKNVDNIEALVTFTNSTTEKKLIETFIRQSFDLVKIINYKANSAVDYIAEWKVVLEKAVCDVRALKSVIDKKEFEIINEYYNVADLFIQNPTFAVFSRVLGLPQKSENDISDFRPNAHNQFIANVKAVEGCNEHFQLFNDFQMEIRSLQ